MDYYGTHGYAAGSASGDWTRRFTVPDVTLDQLRALEPVSWSVMQEFIHLFIRQNVELVRRSAARGTGGEQLHEAVEALVDQGLLRFVQEGPFFRAYVWQPETARYEPAGN